MWLVPTLEGIALAGRVSRYDLKINSVSSSHIAFRIERGAYKSRTIFFLGTR